MKLCKSLGIFIEKLNKSIPAKELKWNYSNQIGPYKNVIEGLFFWKTKFSNKNN